MSTPIESVAALTIGTVESVSPDELKVLLELDAPQATALNTGVPLGFPRVNGYVLIPNQTGAVVGMITWLGVERSPFPKRSGLKDFGLVDLPFPLRKMSLTPVGTLVSSRGSTSGSQQFCLKRGISVFPSVGDPVLLPTSEQLRSIIESEGADRRVHIGVSPLAANASVSVDPNKLFGRHLAVLGNTGSGKSCSVAGLIRWSLREAAKQRGESKRSKAVNSRFIILDPNGEYLTTFSDLGAQVFSLETTSSEKPSLSVPAWMWNSMEWCAFASAAPGAQRPILLQALRDMRGGARLGKPIIAQACRTTKGYRQRVQLMINQGVSAYQTFPANANFGKLLENIASDAGRYAQECEKPIASEMARLKQDAELVAQRHRWASGSGYNDFSETDVLSILEAIDKVTLTLPSSALENPPSEDAPVEFNVEDLVDHLGQLAEGQTAQFIAYLTMRIRMMLDDRRLGPVVAPKEQMTFQQWLETYLGSDDQEYGHIAVLDLSLVSSDVLYVVIAVIARIVFEAVQRYHKVNGKELPTVLVLEEAHTFIQRATDSPDVSIPTPVQMCRHTFERIAREGRKFGLGLVLSSQRPSEISPTVLAQCNTFLLHRIVNDRDQELVRRLVPDNLGGLMRELPSLPTRQAILLGWATPVPILVEIMELPKNHQPQSSDPAFWQVWTGDEDRPVEWKDVAEDWIS